MLIQDACTLQLASGRSATNSMATLRLFDAPDGTEPSVTLYRDKAAWCPYCEKVWLQLECSPTQCIERHGDWRLRG
jgi:hypothetical protein